MDISEYVYELKKHRVYTNKQYKFIDRLIIYTDDNTEVYKVIIAAEPQYLHKANKVNINELYTSVKNYPKTKIKDCPKKIIQLYPKTNKFTISEGELSIREQLIALLPRSARLMPSLSKSEEHQKVSSNESSTKHPQ